MCWVTFQKLSSPASQDCVRCLLSEMDGSEKVGMVSLITIWVIFRVAWLGAAVSCIST